MKTRVRLILMTALCGLAGLLHAQSYTNILSGNWADSTSWKDGRIPPGGAGNQIYFDGAAAMVGTNNLGSLVLNRFQVVAAKNVTLSGNDLLFTNTVAGTLPMLYKDASMVFAVSNNITAKTNMTFYANGTAGSVQLYGTLSSGNLLTKSGTGSLSFENNNAALNGGLSIINGTLLTGLSGAASATPFGTGSLSLYGWGIPADTQPTLSLVPSATGTTTLTGGTDTGSQLSFEGIGFINLARKASGSPLTFTYGSGGGATVLNRINRGTLIFSDNAAGIPSVMGVSGGNNFVVNGSAPSVSNGMVEPYYLGSRNGGQGTGAFLTYDSTYGFKAVTDYTHTNTFAGADSASKVLISSATTVSSPAAAYALNAAQSIALNSTLTLGDGSRAAGLLLNGPGAALSISGSGSIDFGNSEGLIYVNAYNNIIGVPITGSNGVTKTQYKGTGGALILTNDSPNLLGTSVLAGGLLQFGNGGASGSIGGNLKMHPQTTLVYNRTDTNAPIGGVVTPNGGNITVNSGAMTLTSDNLSAGSANTFGTLTVIAGKQLVINGAATSTNIFAVPTLGTNAKLHLAGGVNPISGNFWGGNWALYVSGGVNSLSQSGLIFPYTGSTYSYLGVVGGKMSGSQIGVAFGANSIGVLDISGGIYAMGGGGGNSAIYFGNNTGAVGVYNQTAGSVTTANNGIISVGNKPAGRGEYNLSGGTVGGTGTSGGYHLVIANDASATGIVNLNGGSLFINAFNNSANPGSAYLNFNGGTLVATVAKTFSPSTAIMTIYSKGATIDCGGNAVTLSQSLLAPVGKGVTALPALPGGVLGGYIGSPFVQISGGSGTGATAVAQFDYSTGNVTGLVVTCTGFNYQSGDTVTVTLKGGGLADNALGAATIGTITGGGLTKLGSGTLTLSGTNTYSGATTVSNGVLKLGVANALPNTGAINVAGGTLDLGGFTVTNAQVSGSGLVTNGTLAVTGSLSLTNGETANLLVRSSLTVATGVALTFDYSATTSDVVNVTGTLTLQGTGNTVTLSAIGSVNPPPSRITLFTFSSPLIGDPSNWTVQGALAPGYAYRVRKDSSSVYISVARTGTLIRVL